MTLIFGNDGFERRNFTDLMTRRLRIVAPQQTATGVAIRWAQRPDLLHFRARLETTACAQMSTLCAALATTNFALLLLAMRRRSGGRRLRGIVGIASEAFFQFSDFSFASINLSDLRT